MLSYCNRLHKGIYTIDDIKIVIYLVSANSGVYREAHESACPNISTDKSKEHKVLPNSDDFGDYLRS